MTSPKSTSSLVEVECEMPLRKVKKKAAKKGKKVISPRTDDEGGLPEIKSPAARAKPVKRILQFEQAPGTTDLPEETLLMYYERAKTTIKVLVENMIQPQKMS